MAAGGSREVVGGINLKEVASDILCEFLEVAFHNILYVREVYPQVFFERRRKYNVPVWMCVHPELNQYIKDVLVATKTLIRKGEMDKIVLAIQNKEHQVVERFAFKMDGLSDEALRKDEHLLLLEDDLRATLMKICVCDTSLKPNPPNCTFRVYIHTNKVAAASIEHQHAEKGFSWISADSADSEPLPDATTVPLKSISSSLIQMELLVEECSSKDAR